MQILITEIESLRNDLNDIIDKLRNAGYTKAKAEYEYRVNLAKEILLQRDKRVPVTIINDICRGKKEIALLKLKRDAAETNYDATLEKLRAIKIELGIVERQIEATRKGE